jgi:hypothetical protein
VTATTDQASQDERIPYRGEQPYGVPDDLVVLGALDIDGADERLWVPQARDVTFRPLLLSVSQGYFVNILRVRRSGILSRHRHAGPVHALTLRGRWHYLEHDWWAEQGGYSFEPPGDIHTLVVDDADEMVTLFLLEGVVQYLNDEDQVIYQDDVFTKLERYLSFCKREGIQPADLCY